jgi:hypothetical protein
LEIKSKLQPQVNDWQKLANIWTRVSLWTSAMAGQEGSEDVHLPNIDFWGAICRITVRSPGRTGMTTDAWVSRMEREIRRNRIKRTEATPMGEFSHRHSVSGSQARRCETSN